MVHKVKSDDFSEIQVTMIASSSQDGKKIFSYVNIRTKEITFIVRKNCIIDTFCNTLDEAIEIYNKE